MRRTETQRDVAEMVSEPTAHISDRSSDSLSRALRSLLSHHLSTCLHPPRIRHRLAQAVLVEQLTPGGGAVAHVQVALPLLPLAQLAGARGPHETRLVHSDRSASMFGLGRALRRVLLWVRTPLKTAHAAKRHAANSVTQFTALENKRIRLEYKR